MLTAKKFASRLVKANLASKNDIVVLVKKTNFDDKLKIQIKIILHIKQPGVELKMN